MIASIDNGTALAISVPSLAVLTGIILNEFGLSHLRADVNARFVSLDTHMNARFTDMEKLFTQKLLRVEQVWQVWDARLTNVERRLEDVEKNLR